MNRPPFLSPLHGLAILTALSLSPLSAKIKAPAEATKAATAEKKPEAPEVKTEATTDAEPTLPPQDPPAPQQPEKVHLDGKQYELTFPVGWEALPQGDSNLDAKDITLPLLIRLVYDKDQTNANGTHPARGSFLVSKSVIKPGETANLEKIYKSIVASLAPKGIHLLDEEKAKPLTGLVDGKLSLFATVPSAFLQKGQTLQPDTESNLTLYFILIDCGDRVINLQANIEKPASEELKESCLKVITSFRELK